jgi:hypothetical protein
MGAQGAKETGTNSRHPVERGHRPKGAVRIPVCYDRLGERETHAGQAGQLRRRSGVGIQPLTLTQRPSLPHGAVTLRRGRAGREQREKLDLAWRFTRFGDQIPDSLARNREGNEQEHRSVFGGKHELMVRGKNGRRVGNSAQTAS